MAGNKRWSGKELDYLRKNYLFVDVNEMAQHLGRSVNAIQWKASQLGILIRDGKLKNSEYKIVVNVTKEQYELLQGSPNISYIVRDALDHYFNKK